MRLVAVVLAALAAASFAKTANAFELFPYCDSPAVVQRVKARFNSAEWYGIARGMQIVSIERMSERDVEAFGPNPIYRRYCRGKAHLADRTWHRIYYLIERRMGLAGTGWNVEFCLKGHDPWRVYSGNCRVLRR